METIMKANIRTVILLLLLIAGIVVFFKFPDLDISLLGIGKHRHFLFHSAFFPAAVYLLIGSIFKRTIVITISMAISMAFAFAIGIHLLTDLFQFKAIYFPIIGNLVYGTSLDDKIWLGANVLGCMRVSFLSYRKMNFQDRMEK